MRQVKNIKGCILRPIGDLSEDFKVKGLLLPKDEVSRNKVLYDWESIKAKGKKFEGVSMNYNHILDDDKPPVGKIRETEILEARPKEGKWQKIWDKVSEKNGKDMPGLYYEADIDEEGEYASSIKKGYLDKVSIQVTADGQEEEYNEDGSSYTRAIIGDPLEVSVVKVAGFNQTTMEVAMAEAFGHKKKEALAPCETWLKGLDHSPTDKEVHAWAEENNANVHNVEAKIYKLAKAHLDMGHAENCDKKEIQTPLPEDEADPNELIAGIEVEMEHTDDRAKAKVIALQHLAEVPDYYTKLGKHVECGQTTGNNTGATRTMILKKKESIIVDILTEITDKEASELVEHFAKAKKII